MKTTDIIKKEIQERNNLFRGATKQEKCVLIAKDVLNQISKKFIVPRHDMFVDINHAFLEDNSSVWVTTKDQSVRNLLLSPDATESCDCCALGSLAISCTLFNNNTKIADIKRDFDGIGSVVEKGGKFKNGLHKIFSREQLILIELAFERGEGWFTIHYTDEEWKNSPEFLEEIEVKAEEFKLEPEQVKNALKFNKNIDDATKRLQRIMKNIIKNNGTFIP